MKAFQLAVGLLAGLGAVLSTGAGLVAPTLGLVLVHMLFGAVSGYAASAFLMEALFGDAGLLLDLGRRLDLGAARTERALPPGRRPYRVTHPSAALRDRGARGRLRAGR